VYPGHPGDTSNPGSAPVMYAAVKHIMPFAVL